MKKLSLFKKAYLIYLAILVLLSIVAILYMRGLLQRYEDMRPEKRVEEAITVLAEDALDEKFFTKYNLPKIQAERFEEQIDVKKEYRALFDSKSLTFSAMNDKSDADTLCYAIKNGKRTVAEVKLKALGEQETKLVVFHYREWQIEEIKPILEKSDYTLVLPVDFSVCVNDVTLTNADGVISEENGVTYTISNVYLEPNFEIKNQEGKPVSYTVNKSKVLAEFYDFSLILPSSLTVYVNDSVFSGEKLENNRVSYSIRLLEKPDIEICDAYGNRITYDGKNEIPLTFMTILADSRYSIKVDGKDIAKEAVELSANTEYEQLIDYVENLPQIGNNEIAILKKDAEVLVADESGNSVNLEPGKEFYDFTDMESAITEVPKEVSAEIDILTLAHNWSLFMSDDIRFNQIKNYFIEGSYQYKKALEYATGIDITFVSSHTFADPAFTGNTVTNFKWITDKCFSADVSFVKHMILPSGKRVDDAMNRRIFFVKYDDTDDGIDNPAWKIASMREILEDGNE